MQDWYKIFNDYFNFTKGERNAFLLLLFMILCVIVFPLLFKPEKINQKTDFSYFIKLADSLDKLKVRSGSQYSDINDQEKKYLSIAWNPHLFNPNEVNESTLINMGLQNFLAKRIIKYREKVGPFKIKKDLMKIYGFDSVLFNKLYVFIDLPENHLSQNREIVQKKSPLNEAKVSKIDLNSCDTNDLKLLPGIGSKLSNRIIAYRNSLGGFCKIDQLKNVFGLKPETFEINFNRFYLGTANRLLNINNFNKEALKKHPCFYGKLAEVIISYRSQHGRFNTIEDLKKTLVIDDKWIEDCKCYLDLN